MNQVIDFSVVHQPHVKQREMHASRAKNKVLEWARRLGKSRSALFEGVACWVDALEVPAKVSLVPPWHGMVVAPTFPQAEQAWTELQAFLPEAWKREVLQVERRIDLLGNENRPWGRFEVRSAHDPSALQTAGLDFLWVTEAQDISELAFQRLRPMIMSPDRMGRAIWEGIPALYPDHWWWKLCDFAAKREKKDYFYSHGTAYENPFLTDEQREEIETDRELMPDAAWRRMYLAERSESAGFFTGIDKCIGGDYLVAPQPGARYVAGIDLGRKHDPSVMYVLDAERRRVVYRYGWDAGTEWAEQRDGMDAVARLFDVERVNVDATGMGGDIFYESLVSLGLPVEAYIYTEKTRRGLLDSLAVAIERKTVGFPHEPVLVRQLRAYQFIRRGRSVRPDHPDGEHDDDVMALGLGLLLCDDTAPETPGGGRWRRMSYINKGGERRTLGRRVMQERKHRKFEERMQRGRVDVL